MRLNTYTILMMVNHHFLFLLYGLEEPVNNILKKAGLWRTATLHETMGKKTAFYWNLSSLYSYDSFHELSALWIYDGIQHLPSWSRRHK